jgi:serine/threonine protein phosphatase 1
MAGKVYALSDLHGHFDVFMQMLDRIHFDSTDTLYILGDCNDRGPKAMEIYEYLWQHPDNIFMLKGNHEIMMRNYLIKDNWDCPDGRIWKENGGVRTMDLFDQHLKGRCSCTSEFEDRKGQFRQWMIDYINRLPSYIEVNVGGQALVLIHAGINPELSLYEQDEEICAWIRDYFFMSPGLKGKTILFGHTPTCHLNTKPNCFDVWYDPVYHDKIGIDGGLGPYEDGQLNCICLNDMSVTVIKKN